MADPREKPKEKVAPLPPPPPRTKPNKIAYVITKPNYGGAQRYVFDLATHIPSDAETVVITGKGQFEDDQLLAIRLTEAGVRVVQIPELKRDLGLTDFKALYTIWKVLRMEAPTVLHLNSSKAGGLGALAGRVAHVPKIIFTAHGWPFNEKRNILWRAFAWLASAATIVLCDKVICVSTYDLTQFRGLFFAKKLVGIRNAVPPFNYPDKDAARADLVPRADLYTNNLWVGTLAELNQNKNVELGIRTVAKAIKAGCNILYCVVGDGEERLKLEDLVEELKLQDNIKFLGFVAGAANLMKAFDIFLLPSRKEGMPYAILEAQRAGVPVIASAVGGVPEIVHDGDNGLLCQSENLQQFTDALIRLCKDQELRNQFSKITPPEHFETMLRETFAQYK